MSSKLHSRRFLSAKFHLVYTLRCKPLEHFIQLHKTNHDSVFLKGILVKLFFKNPHPYLFIRRESEEKPMQYLVFD